MKLREIIELTRGMDDKAFLERFACPFLLEEGHLPREGLLGQKPGEPVVPLSEMAERRVFPIRRRDGSASGEVTIGRGLQMDLHLDVQSASTRHAVLKPPGDGRARWVVVDTVSTNGTFVDGVRIAAGREVELGDATVVRFGPDLRLAFYEPHSFLRTLRQSANALQKAIPPKVGDRAVAPKFRPTEVRKSFGQDVLDEVLGRDEDTEVLARDEVRREQEARAKTSSTEKTQALPAQGRGETKSGAVARKKPSDPSQAAVGADSTAINLPGPVTPVTPRVPDPPRPQQKLSSASSGKLRALPASGTDDAPVVILACEPFAPLPLEPFKPVVIGRVPGNDFVLPNPQVSRRHCELERVRGGVVLRDLGSANGTWIDDRRIDRATVNLGGHFQVGPYKVEVRPLDPSLAQPHPGDTLVSMPRAPDGLRGSFDDMPLVEILSGIEFNQKTGVLDVQGHEGLAGFVSFRGGVPHQAQCGTHEGAPAILALLMIIHGRFVLRSDESAVGPREIDASFTKLLLEHGRRRDEGAQTGKKG